MMLNEKIVAIVPAAGFGSRMKSELPKQYMRIGDYTVLEHTLNKLLTHSQIDHVIVAISPLDNYFQSLPVAKNPHISVVIGGETRADSVLSGLKLLKNNEWALVHDAARPCLSHCDIDQILHVVLSKQQGGILAVPVSDTIKLAYSDSNNVINNGTRASLIDHSLDRTYLWAAVTPQVFRSQELHDCLEKALQDQVTITDEASAIEYGGGHPLLIQGCKNNIKITQPEDLALATFYLTQDQQHIS